MAWRISVVLGWLWCFQAGAVDPQSIIAAVKRDAPMEAFSAYQSWWTEWRVLPLTRQQAELTSLNRALAQVSTSLAGGLRGQLYFAAGQFKDAIALTRQAIFLAHAEDNAALSIRWQWQAGRIFSAQTANHPRVLDQAIHAYHQAIASLVPQGTAFPWRAMNCRDPRRPLAYEEIRSLFLELADLLLERNAGQSDLEAVIQTLDLLKLTDVQHYFGVCEFFSDTSEPPNWPTTLGTALVYPVLTKRNPSLLVKISGNSQILLFSLAPGSQNDIEFLARAFFTLLSERRTELHAHALIKIHALGFQLHQKLIAPMEAVLQDARVDTLVFVPEGIVNTLAWAALWDGKEYLIEHYAIAILPALRWLTEKHSDPLHTDSVLAIGLGTNQSGLPYSDLEFTLLESSFPNSMVLRDHRFTRAALHNLFRSRYFQHSHLVSHAKFEPLWADTSIQLFDERIAGQDFMRMLTGAKPADLFVLGACETAQGNQGWAMLGLSGMALKTGIRTILATLWAADDRITYHLLKFFYRHLANQPSDSIARSLQKALLEVMETNRDSPHQWAAMAVIGNP